MSITHKHSRTQSTKTVAILEPFFHHYLIFIFPTTIVGKIPIRLKLVRQPNRLRGHATQVRREQQPLSVVTEAHVIQPLPLTLHPPQPTPIWSHQINPKHLIVLRLMPVRRKRYPSNEGWWRQNFEWRWQWRRTRGDEQHRRTRVPHCVWRCAFVVCGATTSSTGEPKSLCFRHVSTTSVCAMVVARQMASDATATSLIERSYLWDWMLDLRCWRERKFETLEMIGFDFGDGEKESLKC